MKHSLRKTPSQLHLTYKYGERSDSLLGRHFSLIDEAAVLTLSIDLTANFQTRNKTSPSYLDAVNLAHSHHKLESLLCGDNLLRARLIRAWEQVDQPQLRICLDLGQRGRFLYAVEPHSLLTGGIQFVVKDVLEEDNRVSRTLPPREQDISRNHR
ncbi:MAG: hypothetical protein LH617_08200 [Ramlibacter sp.]|nr:hypothetical protein [Ramlibacter sp.]